MELGIIGLGRMGANMTERLVLGGHRMISFDRNPEAIQRVVDKGALGARSLADFVRQLSLPRAIWLMVPSGDPVDQTIEQLLPNLSQGDILIDGGNSKYKDSIRRAEKLKPHGIHFVDAGTSGGIWGLQNGYCLMVGGENAVVEHLEPIFKTLAPPDGYLHVGPVGAGHFVKMIHNGIEYGLMQSFAEGFDILRNASAETLPEEHRYHLNLAAIAELWRRGSVVSSWLLDLAALALAADPQLGQFVGKVADSGEGRWTVDAAIEEEVSADVLTTALYARFRSRRDHTFAEKLLSALRAQFGGHVEPR